MKIFFSTINPLRIISDIRNISFKQGFVYPFAQYFKARPDNSYWDRDNKIALKYRLVMLLCFIFISNSVFLISHSLTFQRELNYIEQYIGKGVDELSKDFPLRLYAYIHFWYSSRDDLGVDEFRTALTDRDFVNKVSQLIFNDSHAGPSELGGAVFLENNSFKFVVLESKFLAVALEIQNALDNKNDLRVVYDKYKKLIEETFAHDNNFVNFSTKVRRWMDREPNNLLPINKYLQIARLSFAEYYAIDMDTMMEQFYGFSQGDYVGNFHIHRKGENVSAQDLEMSKLEDKFVIINYGNKFKVAWLRNGQINKISDYLYNK